MLSWIQQYLIYALMAVIVALGIYTIVQKTQIAAQKAAIALAQSEKKVLQGQVDNSQIVIRQLAVASDELSMRLRGSQADAKKWKARWDKEHGDLGSEIVPNDCKGAATWAKGKSMILREKW